MDSADWRRPRWAHGESQWVLARPNVELTGPTRQDGQGRLAKMYCVPPTGPGWPAVAGPVERRVRPRFAD